jgi:hypothetical protein
LPQTRDHYSVTTYSFNHHEPTVASITRNQIHKSPISIKPKPCLSRPRFLHQLTNSILHPPFLSLHPSPIPFLPKPPPSLRRHHRQLRCAQSRHRSSQPSHIEPVLDPAKPSLSITITAAARQLGFQQPRPSRRSQTAITTPPLIQRLCAVALPRTHGYTALLVSLPRREEKKMRK